MYNITLQQQINTKLQSTQLMPAKSAWNLGVMIDDQLTFKVNVASIARLYQFALYKIRNIRPYLSEHATQLLQTLVISHIEYCILLLAGLPAWMFKPLQMIQNAVVGLVINQPKPAHHPAVHIPHWLPVVACIKLKS